MRDWFKMLHEWSLQWANTKWSTCALFICAFADASFLPLPTPMFFITLTLLNSSKAYKYTLSGTLGTLFGAVAGYLIGHFAWLNTHGEFTRLAQFLFNNIPGFSETVYYKIHILYAKWDFWVLFIASFIPLPYKIFSISSGVFDINLFMFCFATLVSQWIKYYLLALLVIKLGPEIKRLIELKLKHIAIIVTVCIALAIVIIKVF